MLRKQFSKLQEEFSSINSVNLEQSLKNNEICKNEEIVIKEILNASKCKSNKGRRYSEDWIYLCLLFHIKSPATYLLIRDTKVLPLPCTSTIRRYLSLIDIPCGFNQNLINLLAVKFKAKPEINRHFILLLDEMKTRTNVRLNPKTMEYESLQDFGDGANRNINEAANYGLVFAIQPLVDESCQPIAVFTSKGPTTGIMHAKLILQAIIILENAGLYMHGVVSDGASTNRRFWTEFGCSAKKKNLKTSFPHPTVDDRKIFIFSDTPHLIKCIRNRLYDKQRLKTHSNSEYIQWAYFKKLFEIDIKNPSGRLCPKLTIQHIELNNLLKMRVFLAVQIFSKSVARALLAYKPLYPTELEGCSSTAEFCLLIDSVFDALNITDPKKGLRLDSAEYAILQKTLKFLDDWETRLNKKEVKPDEFLTTSTSEGLRATLQSTMDLSKILLEQQKFEYVLTGRINQDPLERFFGTIRLAGGSNDHPCTPTFLQLFKMLSAYSILKPPKLGNCTAFDGNPPEPLITITNLKDLFEKADKINLKEQVIDKLKQCIEHDNSDFSDFVGTSPFGAYDIPNLGYLKHQSQ